MLQLIDKQINYDFSRCQQCGACGSVCPTGAISYEIIDNGLKRIEVNDKKCIKCQKCVKVCPAHRMLGDNYLEALPDKKYFFAWNTDDMIRHDSSSGGATKTIIINSLKSGLVDGVYSLRKLESYPSAVGEFYTKKNIPSYEDLPNSVYHSVIACTEISKVQKVHRLMIVGTSCQLHALEQALKGKYEELIKVCIFCKQQKHLGCTKWLAKVTGSKISIDSKFTAEYRGIGWPGYVRVNNKSIAWEHAAGLPFGRRLWLVPGCDICGDPFGMEVKADISVMDPWVIRKGNSLGETLVTIHTVMGRKLITETRNLGFKEKSYREIEPALGLGDIRRKRQCVAFFKGEMVDPVVAKAAKAELKQRKQLEWMLETLPRLPFIFYRLLNKVFPKQRDLILR